MLKEIKDLGFKVMLWVVPYFTPDGAFWKEQFLDYSG
jgi:alpha-glucosidase (family GH31 glycosyl hydrolase)